MTSMSRRTFLATGTAAAAALPLRPNGQGAPAVKRGGPRPVVIASANGHRFTNGGELTCVAQAFTLIEKGADVLDALIAGVNIVELDPLDDSVGYGGLPNAEGVVQLDASCMHGPTKRAGAVACLEGVRTPSKVARAVLQHTDHHLIVGQDAQAFARQMGFPIEADLNTDHSRKLWLEWKRRTDAQHWLDPDKRAEMGHAVRMAMVAEGKVDPDHVYGTINCNGVGLKGEVCGTTTTSGLAWKIPGRVGDSPILGAGLYVDGEVGAAGSTGRGEANLFGCSSFLAVELMARGMRPKDAGMEVLRRIQRRTVEKRLLNSRALPNFNVNFYLVNAAGEQAGVSLYESRYALCDANGPRVLATESLLPGNPME